MSDRSAKIAAFLRTTPWADAQIAPLAGDASLRKYLRIGADANGRPAVLMDADPELGNDVQPFMRITQALRDMGLSAPEIYAAQTTDGLLLIEDLGDDLFARILESDPAQEAVLYAGAVDVLLHLHRQKTPPLEPYDTGIMTDMAALAYDWYAAGATGSDQSAARDVFKDRFSAALDTHVPAPSVLIQRDYHAENLLWLPDRHGVARVGLLDYQDAMLGHPAYDLVSLLKDARRDVCPDIETAMIARYVSHSDMDDVAFRRAYHVLGLQRNLRILGVFARLSMHYGKPSYVDLIPRVWGFIERDLETDVCAPMAPMLRADLPKPTSEILQRLKDLCGTVPTR